VAFKIISRHALRHLERYVVCVLGSEWEYVDVYPHFIHEHIQNNVQDNYNA